MRLSGAYVERSRKKGRLVSILEIARSLINHVACEDCLPAVEI